MTLANQLYNAWTIPLSVGLRVTHHNQLLTLRHTIVYQHNPHNHSLRIAVVTSRQLTMKTIAMTLALLSVFSATTALVPSPGKAVRRQAAPEILGRLRSRQDDDDDRDDDRDDDDDDDRDSRRSSSTSIQPTVMIRTSAPAQPTRATWRNCDRDGDDDDDDDDDDCRGRNWKPTTTVLGATSTSIIVSPTHTGKPHHCDNDDDDDDDDECRRPTWKPTTSVVARPSTTSMAAAPTRTGQSNRCDDDDDDDDDCRRTSTTLGATSTGIGAARPSSSLPVTAGAGGVVVPIAGVLGVVAMVL